MNIGEVIKVVLIVRNALTLAREAGLTFGDVAEIISKAQAEGREVTEQDVLTYINKRKAALAGLDEAVERASEG